MSDDEKARPFMPEIDGTWPEHCEQRAFVAGAKWWEFASTGATMWQSDQDKAEAEAIKRYGEPAAPPFEDIE